MAPFEIPGDEVTIADLRERLRRTRWADDVSGDWSQGTERGFLRALTSYWLEEYEWDARRRRLALLPQFTADIGGYGMHFLHFRSARPDAVPLLLMNGWPSSFVEFQKLVPILLTGSPCFHVVVPTLPGFGFSSPLEVPYQVEPHDLFPQLMTSLGYDRFVAAGTDIGAGVATRIGLNHPERCLAIHVSSIPLRMPNGSEAIGDDERRYLEDQANWHREEGGYQAIQSTRPQTLAFALADSPVGLASWIVEKHRAWSDCAGDVLGVWTMADLLDNVMVYWLSNSVAASLRYYYEATRLRPPLPEDAFVGVPTAVAVWPADIARPPRRQAERLYDVRRFTRFSKGGHFPAWEVPELYADDIRAAACMT